MTNVIENFSISKTNVLISRTKLIVPYNFGDDFGDFLFKKSFTCFIYKNLTQVKMTFMGLPIYYCVGGLE